MFVVLNSRHSFAGLVLTARSLPLKSVALRKYRVKERPGKSGRNSGVIANSPPRAGCETSVVPALKKLASTLCRSELRSCPPTVFALTYSQAKPRPRLAPTMSARLDIAAVELEHCSPYARAGAP